MGHRGVDLEAVAEVIGGRSVEDEVIPEHGLTDMDTVIERTIAVLRPRTPTGLERPVAVLVEWLGYNPPQRLSYGHVELRQANVEVPELTAEQVHAVANIAWGGRPNQASTSLMGAFLRDSGFDPVLSPTHLRALRLYQQRMHARPLGAPIAWDDLEESA
jgi:hypothetical protein